MKIIIFLIPLLIGFKCFSQVNHYQQLDLKLARLANLDSKYQKIKFKGQQEYANFKSWYFDKYYYPEARKNTNRFSLREIVAQIKNNANSPSLTYSDTIDLVNTFLQFNTPEDIFTILIDGEGKKKILYKSLVYYTIGMLAEIHSGRRKYLEHSQGYTSLENIIINSVTPYFEPGGAGKGSLNRYEEVFFKFYVSLHADFPINLTNDIFHEFMPSDTDEKNDKIVKTTFYMELASYCIKHCQPPKNYIGIQDSTSVNDNLYFLLKTSFQQEFYKNNYSHFEFQDYIPKLLRLLELKKDPYIDDVKASIALATSRAHIANIKNNFSSLASNRPFGERLYSLFTYISEQGFLILKHFFVFIVIKINFPFLICILCLGLLGFSGTNSFSYCEIKIITYTGTVRIKKVLAQLTYPARYVYEAFLVLIAKIIVNIISTYKNVDSPLSHKIAVQGIIVSITVYFSFFKDFISTYSGGE